MQGVFHLTSFKRYELTQAITEREKLNRRKRNGPCGDCSFLLCESGKWGCDLTNYEVVEMCSAAAHRIRRRIIDMAFRAEKNETHLGGSLSMVDLLAGLYIGAIRFQKNHPDWEERDRVILSKGHAAAALYAVLAEAGIIREEELESFKLNGSRLSGHPSLNGLPGIEFASGSLGQGLSQGVGVSLALKKTGRKESRVFVFLGDGECNEGSVWEAASSAAHYGLDNLTAVIDLNGLQYDGDTREILNMGPMEQKWQAFGWETVTVDGHNMKEILDAYCHHGSAPLAIIARTVKGKGLSFAENNLEFHTASLSGEQYRQAIEELETTK